MNRRNFIAGLTGNAFVLTIGSAGFSFRAQTSQVAITMDDPNTTETPRLTAEERNRAILDALLRYPGEDSKYEKAEMDRLGL